MGYSRLEYPYSGGAQDFAVNFALDYLDQTDITVYVQGEVDGLGDQLYRTFTWVSEGTVRVTDPLPSPCTVVVERTVTKDQLEIDLSQTGAVTRVTLVRAFKQLMMNIHELLDGRADSFTGAILDAIVGVRDQAVAAKDAAVVARQGAETAQTRAEDAQAGVDAARDAAVVAQGSAETARDAAQAAEGLAADWAEKPDGQDVNGVGTRSARHHSNQAATARTAAEAARDAAQAAQGGAETARSGAEDALTLADAARVAAQTARNGAQTSETNAAASASAAATSETNASNSADAAAQSAADAAQAAGIDPADYYTKVETDTALAGKSNTGHGHAVGDVSGLQSALNAKASLTGTETLQNKTLVSPKLTGSVEEQVHAITGTTPALDPANGTVQTWTLTGNSTPTASIPNGQSLMLMIEDGASAHTVDWSSAVDAWVGGSAPALPETGYAVITLWAVGGLVYGAGMGDTA